MSSFERLLSVSVFLCLSLYTYSHFFQVTYWGFDFAPSTQEVFFVDPAALTLNQQKIANEEWGEPLLQRRDLLISLAGVNYSEYEESLQTRFTDRYAEGETVPLTVRRGSETVTIQWTVPGPTLRQVWIRTNATWPLGYIFFLVGVVTLLVVRPKNSRRWLLALFCFVNALWIVVGDSSRWGLWDSPTIYRIILWISVPIFLHLHWVLPSPSARVPRWLLWVGYGSAGILAVLQWFHLLPRMSASFGFLFGLLGSLLLLIINFVRFPQHRATIRFLIVTLVIAIVPVLILIISFVTYSDSPIGLLTLASLYLIPAGYFFAIYQRQLGMMQLRANQFSSFLLFLFLILSGITPFAIWINSLPTFPGRLVVVTVLASALTAALTPYALPRFQRLFERRILGISAPSDDLFAEYIARITTSLTEAELIRVLRQEILPGLYVSQSAFVRIRDDRIDLLYNDIPSFTAVEAKADAKPMQSYFAQNEIYLNPVHDAATDFPCWVECALPIRFEHKLIGIWLLGQRDPDDLYPQSVITMLQTLAAQTAVALINTEQSNHLQALFQTNINRREEERTRLARTLHDDVLNQVAIFYNSVEAADISDQSEIEYEKLKSQIRQTISELRPPMLNFGLHAALEEWTEELTDRLAQPVQIQFALPASFDRYPKNVEQHLFRIIQQAVENAVRHAEAQSIRVAGSLEPDAIRLYVKDDGDGFALHDYDPAQLLARRHYGLVGMYERAQMIGAMLDISSAPNRGTRVDVIWPQPPSATAS